MKKWREILIVTLFATCCLLYLFHQAEKQDEAQLLKQIGKEKELLHAQSKALDIEIEKKARENDSLIQLISQKVNQSSQITTYYDTVRFNYLNLPLSAKADTLSNRLNGYCRKPRPSYGLERLAD